MKLLDHFNLSYKVEDVRRMRNEYGKDSEIDSGVFYHAVVDSFTKEGNEDHSNLQQSFSRNRFYRKASSFTIQKINKDFSGTYRCVDVGCGPRLLLGNVFGKEWMRLFNSNKVVLQVTGLDAHEQFVKTAEQYSKNEVFHNSNGLVKVNGIVGDAAENKKSLEALSKADVAIHEVFGSLLGAECMSRLLKNISKDTVVIPDTGATLFKLASFSRNSISKMINSKSNNNIHIYRKVSYVRNLNFEATGGISDNIGILELYKNGSKPGGAKKWAKRGSQKYTSRFKCVRDGVVHALACWIHLGHGDVKKDFSTSQRNRNRAKFQCEMENSFEVRHHLPTKKEKKKKKTMEKNIVYVPRREIRLSTNGSDPISSANEGAWKNPLIFLPNPVKVKEETDLVIASQIKNIGTKHQKYMIKVFLVDSRTPGKKTEQVADIELTMADLYPWYSDCE